MLTSHVRWAWRSLVQTPILTMVAVVSLTLGIGINTAFFSLVDVLLLKPLPVPRPEQLVRVQAGTEKALTYPEFQAIERRSQALSSVAAWSNTRFQVGTGADRHFASGASATGSYFTVFGISAQAGRLFTEQDDVSGALVAVISDSFWKREYGGDPAAAGRSVWLNDIPFTIIGITPPGFFGGDVGNAPEITIPIHANDRLHPEWHILTRRTNWWLLAMGRLKPGITEQQARAQMRAMSPQIMADAFQGVADVQKRMSGKVEIVAGATGWSWWRDLYSQPLLVLVAISGILLLVACVNVAGLLLARSEARQKEMAIRLALGAGRARLISQLLTESVLLSGTGAAFGILFSFWATRVIVRFLSTGDSALILDLEPDARVLAFMVSLAVATGIFFGLFPALRASGVRPNTALKQGSIGIQKLRGWGAARILLCTQMALSVVLLMGALLFVGTLRNLEGQKNGFNQENVVFISLDAAKSGMAPSRADGKTKDTRLLSFYRELLARMRSLSIVHSAAMAGVLPVEGSYMTYDVSPKWRPNLSESQRAVYANRVGPDYFRTLGTAVLRGREFSGRDTASGDPVVIINESAARTYFPGEDAVGREMWIEDTKPYRVAGVVEDARYASLREQAPRTVYFDIEQSQAGWSWNTFAIRANTGKGPVVNAFRSLLNSTGKDVLITRVRTFSEQIDQALVRERLVATIAAFFGVLGIALVSIGLYGLMSFAVARRTSEIGIRLALGALPRAVLKMVLREALLMGLAGLAIGLPAALLMSRVIGSMLYGLKATDPAIPGGCCVLMLVVATLAAAVPARRASRVDAMVALRNE